jgi:glycosyltransferase involved in cell wall biosynthesis
MATGALLVDARPVHHPTARQRGIARYVSGMLRGLTDIGAPVVALYDTDGEAQTLRQEMPTLSLRRVSPDIVREHAHPDTWFIATQLMLHPIPLDPIPRLVTAARIPVAAVMYDVIPYRFPERYQVDAGARNQAALRAGLARTVDTMLAISQFAADTAAHELDYPIERIGVIGAGVDPQFVPARVARQPRPDRVLPRTIVRYVVAVTGGDERKNTEGLLRAWARIGPDVRGSAHLVVVCSLSTDVLRRWTACAVEVGIEHEVVFTDSVEDDEMVALLQGAQLAVMPSFEEGFGLPVLEAAACGIPVICSDTTSLPEVLDEPAACFDPADVDSIARAIERGLNDEGHRVVLLAAGARAVERWTWQRVASDTLDVLARGSRWTQRVRQPPTRLALAGPFDGSESGIGRYDEAVLAALRRARPTIDGRSMDGHGLADPVTALVDGSGTGHPTGNRDGECRTPVRAVGRFVKPWDFDHIIAVLGSSPHHVATAALAAEEPCHVWLHEASLVGLHVGLAHSSGSEKWAIDYVRSVLDSTESAALAASIADAELLDAERLHHLGVTMLGNVLRRARSVIVSSDIAAATVRAVRSDGPPLLVLPLAFPPTTTSSPTAGSIVAAGWLSDNKAPLLALDVLARLATHHDVTLAFVGPVLEETADRVRRAAAELGVSDRVVVTGRLDDEAYRHRVASARVGLQLRIGEHGEMSAAIGDMIAAGVPTVTTLASAGPSSPGLQVVGHTVHDIVTAIEPLLVDDERWAAAATDAHERAGSWTFDDVATALLRWLDDVDGLEPMVIRRCQTSRWVPQIVSPPPHA